MSRASSTTSSWNTRGTGESLHHLADFVDWGLGLIRVPNLQDGPRPDVPRSMVRALRNTQVSVNSVHDRGDTARPVVLVVSGMFGRRGLSEHDPAALTHGVRGNPGDPLPPGRAGDRKHRHGRRTARIQTPHRGRRHERLTGLRLSGIPAAIALTLRLAGMKRSGERATTLLVVKARASRPCAASPSGSTNCEWVQR
jgi:hypothetical protein